MRNNTLQDLHLKAFTTIESGLIYVDGASIKVEKNFFYLLGVVTNEKLDCQKSSTNCNKNDYRLIDVTEYKDRIQTQVRGIFWAKTLPNEVDWVFRDNLFRNIFCQTGCAYSLSARKDSF